MRIAIAFFFLFILPFYGYSQDSRELVAPDTILLNNGKIIITQVTETSSPSVITIIKPGSRKHKKIEIDREDIFSVKYAKTGKEDIYYIYDTLVGHDFTVEDARKFIAGEQDAQKGFHAVGISVTAFVIGFASGDYEGNFFAAVPPFFFEGITSYPVIRVRHKGVRDIKIANTDPYLYGYYLAASGKRMLHSFLWSGIGLVSGLAANFIFDNRIQNVADLFH